jgi:hypothetical protein
LIVPETLPDVDVLLDAGVLEPELALELEELDEPQAASAMDAAAARTAAPKRRLLKVISFTFRGAWSVRTAHARGVNQL